MTITGKITAVGLSYVPVTAYVFVHLSQVSLDEKESFNATANQPVGKAAAENGSQANVTGGGDLHIIKDDDAPAFHNLKVKSVLHSEIHAVRE